MLIKNKYGEIRLSLRFLILMGFILSVAFLLRFIPITIQTQLLVNNGLPKDEALQSAKVLFLETPVWNTILGTIQGVLWLPIVFFLIRGIEKKPFTWKAVGLNWRRTTPYYLLSGFLIGGLVYFSYLFLGQFLGSDRSFQNISVNLSFPSIIMTLILYISLGFGEEVGFRAYLQTRMVKLHGPIPGILFTSIIFTLTHLIFRQLSLVDLLSGVILYMAIGSLYFFSQSLYFVGIIHAVLNSLAEILNVWGGETEGLIVHTVFLLVVYVIYFAKLKTSIKQSQFSDSVGTA
jgi:membrane protease YdiL (CAAX protease family)